MMAKPKRFISLFSLAIVLAVAGQSGWGKTIMAQMPPLHTVRYAYGNPPFYAEDIETPERQDEVAEMLWAHGGKFNHQNAVAAYVLTGFALFGLAVCVGLVLKFTGDPSKNS